VEWMLSRKGKPFVLGSMSVIAGPVQSGKTDMVEAHLDSLVDSTYMKDGNVLVFRHPYDDPNPERIGRHQTIVTNNAHNIYENIQPHTGTVIILGASHYQNQNIVTLTDAIVRSNRQLILSGLNLDLNGKPHNRMGELMALADAVEKTTNVCRSCLDRESTRSVFREGEYRPSCVTHIENPFAEPITVREKGYLEVHVGPMFSGKTTGWFRKLRRDRKAGMDPITFKLRKHIRYNEQPVELFRFGDIGLNARCGTNGDKEYAIAVDETSHIVDYLKKHPSQKVVYVDEAQFFPGLYNAIAQRLPQGYQFNLTGLPRGFNRKKFGEIGDLMCLADKVEMNYAVCVGPNGTACGHPATENQRMKRIGNDPTPIPAHHDDQLEAIGGADTGRVEFFYQARCLKHWILDGEPKNPFTLERFVWEYEP